MYVHVGYALKDIYVQYPHAAHTIAHTPGGASFGVPFRGATADHCRSSDIGSNGRLGATNEPSESPDGYYLSLRIICLFIYTVSPFH